MIILHAPRPPFEKVAISFNAREYQKRYTLVLQDPEHPGVFGTYLALNAKSNISGVVQDGWILVDTADGRLGLPLTRWKELEVEGVIITNKDGVPYFTGL